MLYLRILVVCAVGTKGRGETFCREIWVGPFRSAKVRKKFKDKWGKIDSNHLKFFSPDPLSFEGKPPRGKTPIDPVNFRRPKMRFQTHQELEAWVRS